MPFPSFVAFHLSQHQGLYQWVAFAHQVAKVLEHQLQHQSFQRVFRVDFLEDWLFDLAVQGTLRASHVTQSIKNLPVASRNSSVRRVLDWRICLQCRYLGFILGLGRSPGEGRGNPHQYSCLENLMDRGAWQATVDGIARVGHDLVIKPPLRVLSRVISSTTIGKHWFFDTQLSLWSKSHVHTWPLEKS